MDEPTTGLRDILADVRPLIEALDPRGEALPRILGAVAVMVEQIRGLSDAELAGLMRSYLDDFERGIDGLRPR